MAKHMKQLFFFISFKAFWVCIQCLNAGSCPLVYSRFVFQFSVLFLLLIVNLNKSLSIICRMFQRRVVLNYKDPAFHRSLQVSSKKQMMSSESWSTRRSQSSCICPLLFFFCACETCVFISSPSCVFVSLGEDKSEKWELNSSYSVQIIFDHFHFILEEIKDALCILTHSGSCWDREPRNLG